MGLSDGGAKTGAAISLRLTPAAAPKNVSECLGFCLGFLSHANPWKCVAAKKRTKTTVFGREVLAMGCRLRQGMSRVTGRTQQPPEHRNDGDNQARIVDIFPPHIASPFPSKIIFAVYHRKNGDV
jgi:hypothetical protein